MSILARIVTLGLIVTLVLLALQGEIVTKVIGFAYAVLIFAGWIREEVKTNA